MLLAEQLFQQLFSAPLLATSPETLPPAGRLGRAMPCIMGIVNVTPDSFSDGGAFLRADDAVAHGLRLLQEGADILDIGGQSTRPPGADYGSGSQAVTSEEELRRVIPVIEGILRNRPDAIISIDTMKPDVAAAAVAAGAAIINDVSAGQHDPEIWGVAARAGVPYILMHGHTPHDHRPAAEHHYHDVVAEVRTWLAERIALAREAGVQQIVADCGIGFAKGFAENCQLLREHRQLLALGVPLLVGASRKAFIGRLLGGVPPDQRLFGTLAAHQIAVANGASIIRAHDVRPARDFFAVRSGLLGQEG